MINNQSADIRRTLTKRCARLGIPVSGTFELTPRCNLRCKMCYVRLTPEQMKPLGKERTAAEWLAVAREAVDAGMTFLLITGGEPTLREDFSMIYSGLVKMGLSISVNTNGTLFTPEIRELWHEYPPAQVNVTLYGTCRDDYERLCGVPDAFDRVIEGLDWLQSEGILVHLNTTVTPVNLSHWEEIEEFAKERGLDLRMTAYCFPPVRRDECGTCAEYSRLDPETAGELIVRDMYYREGRDALCRRLADIDTPLQSACDLDVGEPMKCM
ncbi:MAG: radical SAM protein, partial [Clostridia bacterium]|nr:radical SAM protein [Clostridia bacterium]